MTAHKAAKKKFNPLRELHHVFRIYLMCDAELPQVKQMQIFLYDKLE